MKMLPLWMDGVLVWLGEDYGLHFMGENVRTGAVINALYYIYGCTRNWRSCRPLAGTKSEQP